jgi:hypothetical protein
VIFTEHLSPTEDHSQQHACYLIQFWYQLCEVFKMIPILQKRIEAQVVLSNLPRASSLINSIARAQFSIMKIEWIKEWQTDLFSSWDILISNRSSVMLTRVHHSIWWKLSTKLCRSAELKVHQWAMGGSCEVTKSIRRVSVAFSIFAPMLVNVVKILFCYVFISELINTWMSNLKMTQAKLKYGIL